MVGGAAVERGLGVLNGYEIPDRLPPEAEAVLRRLSWTRRAGRNPPKHWFTTLRDAPNRAPASEEVRARVSQLEARLRSEV